MKIHLYTLSAAALLHTLLGCSTPPHAPPPAQQAVPLIALNAPAERPAQLCQISTRCLDLDTKPFGPCLLSTEECPRDGQPMLVAPTAQYLIYSQ